MTIQPFEGKTLVILRWVDNVHSPLLKVDHMYVFIILLSLRAMQQVWMPVPPVVNVSVIFTIWKKGPHRIIFHFIHGSSLHCLAWTMKVSNMMPVQRVCRYVHQLAPKSLLSAYCKWFLLSFRSIIHISPSHCEILF